MPDYQHTEQGRRLKKFREELGLSPKEMAESMGLAYSSYKDIESGRNNISATALRKLLNLYGLDTNWLVNGEGPMRIIGAVSPEAGEGAGEGPAYALLPIIEASGEALVKVRAIEKVFVRLMARALNEEEEWVLNELRKELEVQKNGLKK